MNISDAAFVSFTVLMVVSAAVAYDGVHQELRIRREYGPEEIDAKLFTHRYLKVRPYFIFYLKKKKKDVRNAEKAMRAD